MSDNIPKQNRSNQVDPDLTDVLNMYKRDVMFSMNCHALATIQSFNSDQQTVTATVNYKKGYQERQSNGVYQTVLRDYPILMDCPIISLSGGPAGLTLPIAVGDTCLILFNDRDIDNWFQGGQVDAPASSRLHSFSDGIALVGVRSLANAIVDYDVTRAVLYNGGVKVAVGSSKVEVSNETLSLAVILQELMTALAGLTTSNAVVGSPCTVSAASVTALNAVKTKLQGLLE